MRKTGKWICLILAVLVLFIAGTGIWMYSRGIHHGIRLFAMTRDWLTAPDSDQVLTVTLADAELTADSFWTDGYGARIHCLTFGQMPCYIQDQTLVLDNGKTYGLPAFSPDAEEIRELVLGALLYGQFSCQGDAIHLQLEEPKLTLTAIAREEKLSELTVQTDAEYEDSAIPIRLRIQLQPEGPHSITQETIEALAQPDPPSLFESLEPLLMAGTDLVKRETVNGTLSLALDCGILTLQEQLQFEYVPRQGSLSLTRKGVTIPLELPEQRSALSPAALGLVLLRDGSCQIRGTAAEYSLEPDPETIQSFFSQLIPELSGIDVSFQECGARILIDGSTLQSIHVLCRGEVPFLVTSIPITITMDCAIT